MLKLTLRLIDAGKVLFILGSCHLKKLIML